MAAASILVRSKMESEGSSKTSVTICWIMSASYPWRLQSSYLQPWEHQIFPQITLKTKFLYIIQYFVAHY